MIEPMRVPEPTGEPIRHLFAYGTLLPGLAPREIDPVLQRLLPVGEGFLFGKLYDLGRYPGAILDPASASVVYGMVYELPGEAECLEELDSYEGPEFVRVKQLVTLMAGGVFNCWVYNYLGKPGEDRLITTGRWSDRLER